MTPYEMRRHAFHRPPMRWDDDDIDWRHGALAILAFVTGLAWMNAMEEATEAKIAAEKAHRAAQEARQELQGGAHVRWVGQGYKCQFGRIKREWHQVMATECARVGNMVQAARASE